MLIKGEDYLYSALGGLVYYYSVIENRLGGGELIKGGGGGRMSYRDYGKAGSPVMGGKENLPLEFMTRGV